MRNVVNENVQNFIENHIVSSKDLQKEMEEFAIVNGIPIVTKDTLNLLKTILILKKPNEILELGTAIGYSAIQIAETLNGKCNITTIERNEKRYSKAVENVDRAGYKNRVRLILGDAIESVDFLDRNYDLVFIDAAKGQYQKFFDLIIKNVNQNGIIISDNIFYNSLVCQTDINDVERRQRTIYRRMNDYLNFLTSTKGLFTTLVPIGDGLAITILDGEEII